MIFLKMKDKQGNDILRALPNDAEIRPVGDIKRVNIMTMGGQTFEFNMSFKHFCEKVKAIEENK